MLSFRVHAAVAQTIDVKVADAVVNGQAKEYVAQVGLRGGSDEWQQVGGLFPAFMLNMNISPRHARDKHT